MAKNQQAEVEVNRREKKERRGEDRRKENIPVAVERRQQPRREKVQRRRQIDPTTCEREYNDEEIQFMQALEAYKRANGRMFPTCSEILEVVRGLGYVRLSPTTANPEIPADQQSVTASSSQFSPNPSITELAQ
jgi:hypothetical protein